MTGGDGVARRDLLAGAMGVAAMTGAASGAQAAAPAGEAARIITLAEALEAAEQAKDPDAWARFVAEDYTELNGHFAMILKGRETGRRMQDFARQTPHKIVGSYLSNPDVQIFGDVAILCYVSLRVVSDREGRVDPACRRVTRIYGRSGDGWTLAHTHFSSFDYVSTY